jgi:hypothetical protein
MGKFSYRQGANVSADGGNKMTNYKGYTIEKFSRRGLYRVSDINGKPIAMFTLLRDCKKLINKKVGA